MYKPSNSRRPAISRIFLCVLMATCLILSSCTATNPKTETQTEASNPQTQSQEEPLLVADFDNPTEQIAYESPNYEDSARWIARPSETPLPVDVFYLYPTAWHKIDAGESNLCAIDNKTLLEGGEQAFAMQATAFETAGNVFAPYYRQGDASFVLGLPIEQQTKLLNGTPKQDIYAALDYYFEYLNEGRPFILAGHSQGSNMLLFVLSEYLQMHPELQDRMVAAYAIGYSITDSFLSENKHLSFAEKADDTGVIVSYNTEAPTVEGKNPVVIDGALAINPLTWTRSTETASASLSKGARMNGVDLGPIADASVDLERGTVICSSVNPDDYISATGLFPRGVYHGQDYGFYYYDLRANAEQRAQAYLESHS